MKIMQNKFDTNLITIKRPINKYEDQRKSSRQSTDAHEQKIKALSGIELSLNCGWLVAYWLVVEVLLICRLDATRFNNKWSTNQWLFNVKSMTNQSKVNDNSMTRQWQINDKSMTNQWQIVPWERRSAPTAKKRGAGPSPPILNTCTKPRSNRWRFNDNSITCQWQFNDKAMTRQWQGNDKAMRNQWEINGKSMRNRCLGWAARPNC